MDKQTIRAIWAYQQTNSSRLLNIDGKIHPASYADRVIKGAYSGGRLMAITLLNMLAQESVVLLGADSIADAVKRTAPDIMFT